jgi:Tol biopolymer transport system component
VAFSSAASNLVAGDTNGVTDVFLRDSQTGTTTRVSVDSSGAEAADASYEPSVNGDGRFIAFRSAATNLVAGDTNAMGDIFLRDTQTGTSTRVNLGAAGVQANASSMSPW